jgi:hypothetical protein
LAAISIISFLSKRATIKVKLIYIDESGNTGTRADDAAQPYHLLAAVAIDDFNVRTIENDIRTLGLKHFGAISQNTDFEFHG